MSWRCSQHSAPYRGSVLKDIYNDIIIDLELTPNRPDCLGMYGIAREIAALTKSTLKESIEIKKIKESKEYSDNLDIKILERYKNINGMEGNSPISSNNNFSSQGSPYPENEDLNEDNTLSDTESYFEYE